METTLLNSHHQANIAEDARYTSYLQQRPSTIYKPRAFPDGNMWCALYGENIQEGVAGFGKSPALAMQDFDDNWRKEIK